MAVLRGQVEFILIFGLVIVAVIAILWAWQSGLIGPPPLTGIALEKETVKQTIIGFAKEGVSEILKNISQYGGYLSPQPGVLFLGKPTPYWLASGEVSYPDLTTTLTLGLKNWLDENRLNLEVILANISNMTLGEPIVSVQVLDNKLNFQLNWPTTVKDSPIEQPYQFSVDTKIGEIYDFAIKFSNWEREKRFFEYAILNSMLASPYDEGVQTVPVVIALTECGEYVFKTWYDIAPEMEKVIKGTYSNIYMPGKVPTGTGTRSAFMKYSLVPLDGKSYSDLDVSFFLPDDFYLDTLNFNFQPDPIIAWSEPIPMTGMCFSEPKMVNYFLDIPAVVAVEDPLTGNIFRFAIHVQIKDNKPSDWSGAGYTMTEQQAICEESTCLATIRVRDSQGSPIAGASISFMGCPLGLTGSDGVWDGLIPCGIGPLEIYKDGFNIYDVMSSSTELLDKTVSLTRMNVITLYFYEVNVQNLSTQGVYQINPDGIVPLGTYRKESVLLAMVNTARPFDPRFPQRLFDRASAQMELPAGTWSITAAILQEFVQKGAVATAFTIPEGTRELHIYIPYLLQWPTEQAEQTAAALAMNNILVKCGMGPVSTSPVQPKFCSVGYNEVFAE